MVSCSNCGTQNIDGSKFCTECGSLLAQIPSSLTTVPEPTQTYPQYPTIAPPKKGLSKGQKFAIIGGVLLVILILVAAISSLPSSPVVRNPVVPPSWHQSTSYSGSGDKTTSVFSIRGSQYRLQWQYTADRLYPEFAIFSFFVYPEGEDALYVTSVIESGPSKTDTEYVYRSGGFYFKVIAGNVESWSITVEDYY